MYTMHNPICVRAYLGPVFVDVDSAVILRIGPSAIPSSDEDVVRKRERIDEDYGEGHMEVLLP